MTRSAGRATLLVGALLSVSIPWCAPAAAQDVMLADSLLWPSWSESLAEVGLGGERTLRIDWGAPEGPRPRALCKAAGALGATAGVLAAFLGSEPAWPAGFDHFPARRWRSLPGLGAAFGKALVCPPTLALPYSAAPPAPDL